jgi:hypothetical protein
VLIISHRGNINGPDKTNENRPEHILKVLEFCNVEVDAWYVNEKWFLGHDEPVYEVDFCFFRKGMWVHCKNIDAVTKLAKTDINWFWHESDKVVLTNHKYFWCFPGIYIKQGITVEFGYNKNLPKDILGICTDYPGLYL